MTEEITQEMNVLAGQPCPMCKKESLTLTEKEIEVPFFGKLCAFSMSCIECKYHKADVEALENKGPCKYTFEITSEDDMTVRVVRSGEATVKLPHIVTIEGGPSANGYVTNIEGILKRVKHQIETVRDNSDDNNERKKSKNLLKKLNKVMWGQEKLKIIIEDKTGNSAIISDKAVKSKL